MAKLLAIGAAQAVPQIDTVTMSGTFADTETVTIKVGPKSVVYTCGTGETVSTVAAALLALCRASTDAEFREVTWTAALGVITATSPAGIPVTVTASDTAASGAATVGSVQAATGPYHWNNVANWSTGAVPTTNDEVFIEDSAIDLRYGLPTSVTLDKFVQRAGRVGLPDRNAAGYSEYRPTRAVFTCVDVQIGRSPGAGPVLSRLDLASGASVVSVFGTSQLNVSTEDAVDLVLNNASAVVNVMAGRVTIADAGDETSTVATVRVAVEGSVTIGAGVTVTSVVSSGTTLLLADATNVTVDSGVTTLSGEAVVTNLTIRGGTVLHNSSGTITAAVVGPGTLDCDRDIRPRTITDLTLNKTGILRDTYSSLTITNGIVKGADADVLQAT